MDIFQLIRNNLNDDLANKKSSIDINTLNEFGENLLHEAIEVKNVFAAKILLEKGVNVNHQDKQGNTPLHYIGEMPNVELLNLVLENGGDLSISNIHGNTPVWTMVFNVRGNYSLIDAIKKYNPDVNIKNKAGRSPLDFAKQINDQTLISKLEGDI